MLILLLFVCLCLSVLYAVSLFCHLVNKHVYYYRYVQFSAAYKCATAIVSHETADIKNVSQNGIVNQAAGTCKIYQNFHYTKVIKS